MSNIREIKQNELNCHDTAPLILPSSVNYIHCQKGWEGCYFFPLSFVPPPVMQCWPKLKCLCMQLFCYNLSQHWIEGRGNIWQKEKPSLLRIEMNYYWVVQPSQLLLSRIVDEDIPCKRTHTTALKSKRGGGSLPLILWFTCSSSSVIALITCIITVNSYTINSQNIGSAIRVKSYQGKDWLKNILDLYGIPLVKFHHKEEEFVIQKLVLSG